MDHINNQRDVYPCFGSERQRFTRVLNSINKANMSQERPILVVAPVRRSALSYHHCHLAPSSHQIGPNFGFIKSFKGKRELAKIETEILRSCSFVRLHLFKTRSRIEGTGSKIWDILKISWLSKREGKRGEIEGPVSNSGREALLRSTCFPTAQSLGRETAPWKSRPADLSLPHHWSTSPNFLSGQFLFSYLAKSQPPNVWFLLIIIYTYQLHLSVQ